MGGESGVSGFSRHPRHRPSRAPVRPPRGREAPDLPSRRARGSHLASGALAVRADHGARANALKDELGEEGAAAALLDKEGIKDFKFHATVQSRTADRMAGVPRAPLRGAAAAPAGG